MCSYQTNIRCNTVPCGRSFHLALSPSYTSHFFFFLQIREEVGRLIYFVLSLCEDERCPESSLVHQKAMKRLIVDKSAQLTEFVKSNTSAAHGNKELTNIRMFLCMSATTQAHN